jgi:hypothetical protein
VCGYARVNMNKKKQNDFEINSGTLCLCKHPLANHYAPSLSTKLSTKCRIFDCECQKFQIKI